MPAGVDYAMGNKRNSKWPLAKHNELRKMRDENARLDDLLEQAKAKASPGDGSQGLERRQ